MARPDGRRADELRPVKITRHFLKSTPASVLIEMGRTRVICAASIEGSVPPFLAGKGRGWVTAEYGMIPPSTPRRKDRDRGPKVDGRTIEIQRLVGRSLRAVVDMAALGERSIRIDCDVIDADGGTRTAAITGAYVALADAVEMARSAGQVTGVVLPSAVAAVSVGLVEGKPVLDLSYAEDSTAEVDMNIVMTSAGRFVEIQGTGEEATFGRDELDAMLDLAAKGIRKLLKAQQEALAGR